MHLRHLLSTALLLLAALSQAADFTPSGGRPYSAAVRLAVGTDFVMTSGGIAIPQDPRLDAADPARYGDTYLQARSALARHAQTLAQLGLKPTDVVYARAYLVADAAKDNQFDWSGWDRAFTEFFKGPGGAQHRPTRTTLGISALGRPELLIEIELLAAYPVGVQAPEALALNPMLAPLTNNASRIAQAVAVRGQAPLYFTSGMLADPANPEAPASAPGHMGDMAWQARSALGKLDANLRAQGLTFRDVYFLRAMLAPDLRNDGAIDFAAWNAAYDDFFNNAENPHRPARTTMAAPGFNSSNRIIEIEAYAAYPDALGAHRNGFGSEENPNLIAHGDPKSFLADSMSVARHASLTVVSGSIAKADVPRDAGMEAQARSALETLGERLASQGLGFEDVIQLRAYLDVGNDFGPQFQAWNRAYGAFFNNEANPHRPVRTALPVVALPGSALIEIEATAAAPR
jgi:enamine deaminase RidA (YjgF/YER057c/UK114 family)